MSDHYPVEVELKSLSYVEGNLRTHCARLISRLDLKKKTWQTRKTVREKSLHNLEVVFVRADQHVQVPVLPSGMVAVDADLMELKRENLLLEREKLGLEIQVLRAKMAKLNKGDAV